jgi:hypothetical protein
VKSRVVAVNVHTRDGQIYSFPPKHQVAADRNGDGFRLVPVRDLKGSDVVHVPAAGRLRTVVRAEAVERSS